MAAPVLQFESVCIHTPGSGSVARMAVIDRKLRLPEVEYWSHIEKLTMDDLYGWHAGHVLSCGVVRFVSMSEHNTTIDHWRSHYVISFALISQHPRQPPSHNT